MKLIIFFILSLITLSLFLGCSSNVECVMYIRKPAENIRKPIPTEIEKLKGLREKEIWDFVGRIKEYQNPTNIPDEEQNKLNIILKPENAEELRKGFSVSYPRTIKPWKNDVEKKHAIHITKILIDVPFDQFVKKLPPDEWAMNLADLEIIGKIVYERDDDCRVIKQIERMRFGSFLGTADLDMTKTETIEYEDDMVAVYWRVYFSDNKTTDEDLGKVEFRKHGKNGTLVTFHSAHRFTKGKINISTSTVLELDLLGNAFKKHVLKYKELFTEL